MRKRRIGKLMVLVVAATLGAMTMVGTIGEAAEEAHIGAAVPPPPGFPVKIGIVVPLSGDVQSHGEAVRDSALIAIEQARDAGWTIETVQGDSQCDAQQAVSVTNDLILNQGVHYIVGAVCSSASIPMSEIAEANHVVQIAPTSTNPEVTAYPDGTNKAYVFRVPFLDRFQGKVMATVATQDLGATHAAVLYNQDNDYISGLAESFQSTFQDLGGAVPVFESYTGETGDFSDLLTQVDDAGVSALFLPDFATSVNQIAQQADAMGLETAMLGADTWDSPALQLDLLEGAYFSTHFSPQDPRPIVVDFVEAYSTTHGSDPHALAALGYDATSILLQAIAEAGVDDPAAVKETVAAIDYEGLTGGIAFNHLGDALKGAAVIGIEAGATVFDRFVSPISSLTAANSGPTGLGDSTTLTATLDTGYGVSYTWCFGDGAEGSGRVVSHTYAEPGTYTAVVTATNGTNTTVAQTLAVVSRPASGRITLNMKMAEPITLDPAQATDTTSTALIEQLFIGLVDLDDETGQVQPELAISWTVSPDDRTYTFTLRSDARWSDGNPVTAHDVRYGILRTLAPETGSGYAYPLYVIENAQPYNEGASSDPNQVGVTALDSTTLRITFEHPASYALSILSMWMARPMPQWAIEAHGGDWTDPAHIVTSGPYRLSEWVHNDHITLEKSPTYYDAADVQIERVNMWMVDNATAWQMYLDGELDTTDLPLDHLDDVQANPQLSQELNTAPNPCTYYYGFSISQEPFNDPLVRRAFAAATNRQGLIDEVTGAGQQPALTFTPPGVFGHVDGYAEGVGIPHNPSQAQQVLADAGHPDGAGLPPITLWFNTSPGHQAIAEYLRDGWQATLGVSVTLESMSWNDYLDTVQTGQFQIWRFGWCMDYADANNFLNDGIDPARFGNWDNSSYQSLVDQAAREQDPAVRRALYKQAEEILVETDAVMIPIYHYTYAVLTKPYLARTYPAAKFDIATWRITQSDVIEPEGGTLTSYDGSTTVEIPGGALTDTVVLTHTPVSGVPAGALYGIGASFDLTAVYSQTGEVAQIAPDHPLMVTVHYSDTQIGPVIEETLALYRWEEGTGNWSQSGITSTLDVTASMVRARVAHLSRFAVLGETKRVYLPLITRGH